MNPEERLHYLQTRLSFLQSQLELAEIKEESYEFKKYLKSQMKTVQTEIQKYDDMEAQNSRIP